MMKHVRTVRVILLLVGINYVTPILILVLVLISILVYR